jgi:hypothetical protein
MAAQDLNATMEANAILAVRIAREAYHFNLNFSEGSVAQLEKILEQLHRAQPHRLWQRLIGRGLKPADFNRMTHIWGGYLGEVMRRQWGGTWSLTDVWPTKNVITLEIDQLKMFPPSKVRKRLLNGSADNITYYHHTIVMLRKKGTAGLVEK